MNNLGRLPVNAPHKVQRQPHQEEKNTDFDASWDAEQVAPNSFVNMKIGARTAISAKTVEVRIFQYVGNRKKEAGFIVAPLVNGKAIVQWQAKPLQKGDFETGIYHFEVSAGHYRGETVRPLLIRDLVGKRNVSSFETARPNQFESWRNGK